MDGYAVAKALRNEPSLRDMYVVALTGHALAEDERSASEAGFDGHVTKPASIARIQEIIGRAPSRPLLLSARPAAASPAPGGRAVS
jgi:CheY-like chemotaxis protein